MSTDSFAEWVTEGGTARIITYVHGTPARVQDAVIDRVLKVDIVVKRPAYPDAPEIRFSLRKVRGRAGGYVQYGKKDRDAQYYQPTRDLLAAPDDPAVAQAVDNQHRAQLKAAVEGAWDDFQRSYPGTSSRSAVVQGHVDRLTALITAATALRSYYIDKIDAEESSRDGV